MAGDLVRREGLRWKKVPRPHRGKLTGHSRGSLREKVSARSAFQWNVGGGERKHSPEKKIRPDGGRGLRLWGQCVLLRTRCRRSELNQHHPRVGGRRSGQEGGQGGWWVLYQDTTVVGSTTITQAFTQPIRQRWAENKLRRIIYDKWGNYLENTIFNFDLQTRKLGISAGSCPSVWFWAAWL